jgi:hypothetical protein
MTDSPPVPNSGSYVQNPCECLETMKNVWALKLYTESSPKQKCLIESLIIQIAPGLPKYPFNGYL